MATPGRAPIPNAAPTTFPPVPALLLAMLQVSSHVSDLIFSPGSHPHVEVSGQLVPVKIPGLVSVLSAEATQRIAAELMGDNPSVLGPGHPINVAWMKGRIRPYTVAGPARVGPSALAVAFNDHCDAIVATVVSAHDQPAPIEPSVIEFLNSEVVVHWAEVTLGL